MLPYYIEILSRIITLMDSSFWAPLDDALTDVIKVTTEWFSRNSASIGRITLIIFFAWLLNHYAHNLMHAALEKLVRRDHFQSKADKEKRIKTLTGMGSALIKLIVWITAAITVINISGINIAPIMTSAGIVGIALGLGSQKLINDLVAGIFIIFENQYRIGDYIEVEGVSGTVEDISVRITTLRDLSGAVHHVPNGLIGVSTNRSMGYGQINLDLMVEPTTDLTKLTSIINKVGKELASQTDVKDEIIEAPQFNRVTDFTGNGITVKITGKTTGGKQLEIKSTFFTMLKNELDKNKIRLAHVIIPTQK